MKKGRLIHAELSGLIASLGHGDLIVIGDAGLPVPPGVRCIDLAVTRNLPGIFDVLDAVLTEMAVERALIATEAAADLAARFRERLTADAVPHDEFKRISQGARAIIRSGEYTPYANIALFSGVVF